MTFKQKIPPHKTFWLSSRKFICFLFFILLLSSLTSSVQAGVVAFFTDLFSGQKALAESQTFIDSNSQTMSLLEADNTLNPVPKSLSDITIVGDEALLPEVGPSNIAPEKADTFNGQISVYTVRSGDTLSRIAEMFDVSANTIRWANDLGKDGALRIDQVLVILPMSGVRHTVTPGDTLSTIAKKYAGDLEEIAEFNNLKISDKLSVGDIIMIPDGEIASSVKTSNVSSGKAIISTGPSYDGYYQKPFIGGHKTQGFHGYNAVDYGMPTGSSIYAAANGTVLISRSSGWNGGYGVYVVIKHPNNTQTVYAHLSQTLVSVGQTVTQGQLIGYSGNTGKSTGPHLHFEVRGAKNPF